MHWWEIQFGEEVDKEQASVFYTNFIECQYCGTRFGHGDTETLNNHWRECKHHPAQAEIERLRAVNARLLAACEEVLNVGWLSKSVVEEIEQAIAEAESQPPTQPTGPKLPGLE